MIKMLLFVCPEGGKVIIDQRLPGLVSLIPCYTPETENPLNAVRVEAQPHWDCLLIVGFVDRATSDYEALRRWVMSMHEILAVYAADSNAPDWMRRPRIQISYGRTWVFP